MDKLGKFLQRDLVNASPSRFLMDDVKENEMASSLPQNVTADYVRAIGSDGKSYRIPKADFASIIRSELGTILNGLSDQQTVTKVPTLNGSTLGASAVATLASLLGEAGIVFQKTNTAGILSNVVRVSMNSNASITLLVTRNFYNLPAFAAIIQIGRNTGEYGMNDIVPSDGISFSFDNTNGNITIGHNNQGNGLGTIRITILQRSTGAIFIGEVDN